MGLDSGIHGDAAVTEVTGRIDLSHELILFCCTSLESGVEYVTLLLNDTM